MTDQGIEGLRVGGRAVTSRLVPWAFHYLLGLFFLGVLFFLGGPSVGLPSASGAGMDRDQSSPPLLPSLVLKDLTGRRINTASFSGHPLLILNFMAPWCAPCLQEIPSLSSLARGSEGMIRVQGILEGPTGPDALKRFIGKHGPAFPLLLDPSLTFSRAMGVRGLPTTFVVDSGGRVVSRVTGAVDWNDPRVRRYLKSFISSKAGF